MLNKKFCPDCGAEILEGDVEFCTQCGCSLVHPTLQNSNGYFGELVQKTSFPVIMFSFVVFGIFLFVGSIVWSLFIVNGSIDLITYIILTVVFSVFFGGIFMDISDALTNPT